MSDTPLPIPSNTVPSGHARQGDIAILDRRQPLPPCCILSGVPASRTVWCLFHWQQDTLYGGSSPTEAFLRSIRYYVYHIPKAVLRLPVSEQLRRRRRIAWTLCALTVVLVVATIAALLAAQRWISDMPRGARRDELNAWVVPAIALGGWAGIALLAYTAYRIMPALTVRLKVQRIDKTHVWLTGAAPEFLQALSGDSPE